MNRFGLAPSNSDGREIHIKPQVRPLVNSGGNPTSRRKFMTVWTYTILQRDGNVTFHHRTVQHLSVWHIRDLLPKNLKSLPFLQAEKLSECDRDIRPLTVNLFGREAQGSSFLVVLFLHYKTRYGAPGTFSKVAIDSVTSSAYVSVPRFLYTNGFRAGQRRTNK